MANLTKVTLVNGAPTDSGDVSTIDALLAIIATAAKQDVTHTDLAAILAKLTADPATQTTLAAVLAKLNASIAVTGTFFQATQPVSAAALPLPAGAGTAANQATIIADLAKLVVSATANGATSTRINSAASANAAFLKASAGQIYEIDLFNNAAYTVFVKFFNKASAPTLGTDVPVWTMPIPPGTGFSREFIHGKTFATGIAYAITKLQADTDTTAIAAGDVTGAIDWI